MKVLDDAARAAVRSVIATHQAQLAACPATWRRSRAFRWSMAGSCASPP